MLMILDADPVVFFDIELNGPANITFLSKDLIPAFESRGRC
jgi:hypothetical protein